MPAIFVPKRFRDLRDAPAPEEGKALLWSSGALALSHFRRPLAPSAVLYESAEVAVAQSPNTVMLNDIVDMSRFALTVTQDMAQCMVVVTKAGPGGTRVTTSSGVLVGPDDPPADAPVGGLIYGFTFPAGAGDVVEGLDWESPGEQPAAPDQPQDFPTSTGAIIGAVNAEVGNLFHGNRMRFLRAYVARDATPYTPEEWAQIAALDYRVKLQVMGPVQQVAEWVFPIPAAPGALICNQVVDLQRYGMTLGYDDCKFVATFERNGQPIRHYPGVPGVSRDWPTYTGEAFDPPSYPVEMDLHAWYPGYEHEVLNSARAEWFRYGAVASGGNGFVLPGADAWASVSFGACTRDVHSTVIMRAWRTADDGATEYVPAEGEAALPVPAGAKDGCTLRIRLFRPHRLRQGYYPWFYNSETASSANITLIRRRAVDLRGRIEGLEGRLQSDAVYLTGPAGATFRVAINAQGDGVSVTPA